VNPAFLTVVFVADEEPRNTGPEFGKASPFGLLIIVLLLLGTAFLVWSMNRQLKKVPRSFDRADPEPDRAAGDDTAAAASDSAGDGNESGSDRNTSPPEPGCA
jgi:hypothetical protein